MEKALQDPAVFAEIFFNFTPTDYQANLLRDESKRIVVRWSRQSGKTTTIALRAIWYSLIHSKTLTLIVAPSLRQSMIMSDRITDFLSRLPAKYSRLFVKKLQRTCIQLKNGSRIIALPNNPQLLRGYSANQAICDEAAFFREDKLIFYNVLYPMLSTTDGILIASSTPWSKDSVFHHFCQHSSFSKHTITCEDVKASGLIKQDFIDEMRSQLPYERFQREMMSEFIEDVDTWLTQSLIVSCIDSKLEPYSFESIPTGDFYLGVDFGKEQDHSVVAIVEKLSIITRAVHVHRFPLKTPYSTVIGYVKSLQDRWKTIHVIYADITGVGNYITEDMVNSSIQGVNGISFTTPKKEEMAQILREKMRRNEIKIPYTPPRKLQDIDLTAELNIERYELLKTGHYRFSHPEGSHDDVFWSLALAVYGSVQVPPPGRGAVMLPH